MDLYPAIDLRSGRVVRLSQGEAERQTVYGSDPAAQARTFVETGAQWVHVVDLDRAFGTGDNDVAVAAIVAAVAGRARVQVGGGVRSLERAAALVGLGVSRVVVGTAAVEQPELLDAMVAELGAGRIAVGIDARDGIVALRGWTELSPLRAIDLASRVASQGIGTVIATDIARDGMLGGPDIAGSVAIAAVLGSVPDPCLIVSGGVATLDDLRAIATAGLGGCIVGRALYEERFSLRDALAAVA
ncbi:MAG: 1-(5-phosphoribosyl)-5-[(5-phosphoribosylamino)methylideneamino]imidazole-4-carboxamide isomerase [Gemmatimonadales bacterium]